VSFASFVLATGTSMSLEAQVSIDYTRSLLLEWPEPTEECIVVGTTSLANPVWLPWPEPILNRSGRLSMAVSATNCLECFMLVPGTQFIDDFSEPRQPFAGRSPYEILWADPNDNITITNGTMRIRRGGPTWEGVLIRPPEQVVVHDFYSSVDILDFTASEGNWCSIIVLVNGVFRDNQGRAEGNGAGLTFNAGVSGRVLPFVYNGSQKFDGQLFYTAELPPPYRLEFSAVGSEFRFRVVHLATKTLISERQVPRTAFFQGWVGLFVESPTQSPTTHELSLDNLFVTGTKP